MLRFDCIRCISGMEPLKRQKSAGQAVSILIIPQKCRLQK